MSKSTTDGPCSQCGHPYHWNPYCPVCAEGIKKEKEKEKRRSNFLTHTILLPENCDCRTRYYDGYCSICDGGLEICTVCKMAEVQLLENECN